jgi:hypothetical protein
MNAIEFQAVSRDGVVEIPSEFRAQWGDKKVRVILLEPGEETEKPAATLLARLRRVRITGPEDFSENIDAYLSGEKNV